MNSWKVILATMVIFGTGVVTGGLLVRHAPHRSLPRFSRPANQPRPALPVSPGAMRLEFLRRAQRDLDLTPEQRERADKLIKESQERSHKIIEPVASQLRQELDRTRDRFLELLTPPQRERFETFMKQQQQRRNEPRKPGGPREHSVTPPAATNTVERATSPSRSTP